MKAVNQKGIVAGAVSLAGAALMGRELQRVHSQDGEHS
jgi:hypothetical protein